MRSRIVTPQEMREVYGAEVMPFRFAFSFKRGQANPTPKTLAQLTTITLPASPATALRDPTVPPGKMRLPAPK